MYAWLVASGFFRIVGAVALVQVSGIVLFYIVGSYNARRYP